MLRELLRRLVFFVHRSRFEHELTAEIQAHLQMRVDDLVAQGTARLDAEAQARREFGSEARSREATRDAWRARWLADFGADLRYAARSIRRNPGFSLTVALTLAVGIGASTAMFSVVNSLVVRPLPYPDASRLAILWTDDPKHNVHEEGVSYPTYSDWRRLNRSFDDVGICSRPSPVILTRGAEPEQVDSTVVSANVFSILGVTPLIGRSFTADDTARGDRLILISHGLFQRRFGGQTSALGTTLEIDGAPWRVIGVMPPSFQFPSADTQLWLQLTSFRRWRGIEHERYSDWGRVVARLRTGVTLAQAQADMTDIGRRLQLAYPAAALPSNDFAGFGVNVVPLTVQILGRTLPRALWILFASVLCVLLIACVNVGNLVLARGAARHDEMAVRRAIGAGTSRLLRQLMTEALALAAIGGAMGAGLAVAGVRLAVRLAPATIARMDGVRVDSAALGFAAVTSVAVAVLFGLAPAFRLSRLQPVLNGRGPASGAAQNRLGRLLVTAEIALAAMLVCGAGLLLRSLALVSGVETGFSEAERALTVRLSAPGSDANSVAFYRQVIDRVRALPGVTAAGAIEDLLQRRNPDYQVIKTGGVTVRPEPMSGDAVTPAYFEAAGVRLLKGRFFSDADAGGSAPAIVDETMARHLWPGEDPIGKQFREADELPKHPWYTVVGVVADMRREGLDRTPIAQMFWPHMRRPNADMDVVVRVVRDPLALLPSVRQVVKDVDKRAVVVRASTLERALDRSLTTRRFQGVLMGAFSLIALGLGALGVYGLLHYSVTERTPEIAVRLALGAQPAQVMRMFAREGLTLAVIGVAAGLTVAIGLSQTLSSLLFGIATTDAVTFVSAGALVCFAAVGASAFPAWRAARTNSLIVLRQ
jgi:predicted permease